MAKDYLSCLIPVYNEAERLEKNLAKIVQIRELKQIICVNDGSTDNSAEVAKQFAKVTMVNLKYNTGKTGAIREGLKKVSTESVMLIDADLHGLIVDEIRRALRVYTQHKLVMLILRRVNSIPSTKLIRGDILFTGERILKKADLAKILKNQVNRFQLEAAINDYYFAGRYRVAWTPFSALSTYKIHKRGFWQGLIGERGTILDVLRYKGLGNYFWQYWRSMQIEKLL